MQVAYVLTGDSLDAASRYVRGVRLSVRSLRRIHPGATVHCLCDAPLARALRAADHPLGREVDRLVECGDATGGPTHRSRHLKITLRGRLAGRFLYLDADTVVAGPLDDLFASSKPLGITLDAFFPEAIGQFPAWLAPHYRRLGWLPSNPYYNGGIFSVADSDATHRLFRAWHAHWRRTVAIGLVMDQPGLNRAIQEQAPELEIFPETYNFLIGRAERTLPPDARVLSFLASLAGPMHARYESALAHLDDDSATAAALDALTAAGTLLPRREWSRAGDWTRRLREALAQAGARHRLRDASQD